MTQEQLINKIEQRLEDLMVFDEDLAYQYDCDYYDENDNPIVELFTPQLLQEIEQLIEKLDQSAESLDYFNYCLTCKESFNS